MPAKRTIFKITDQFCGCGGNSAAAENVNERMGGGIEVSDALNHWDRAIQTHTANFPNTRHHKADMSTTDPRKYESSDMLITSPECTEQGYAIGKKKPTNQTEIFGNNVSDMDAERSRATMWDVVRFTEAHNYNYIIVENVHQARTWVNFENWLRAMHTLGYKHKAIYFNSRFAFPTPQSRDRMYIHFWKKGNTPPDLSFKPKAHCERCNKNILSVQTWKRHDKKYGVYGERGQYLYCCPNCSETVKPLYYAAINAIDLSDLGTKIGDRKVPLVPNTINRIKVGREKLNGHPFYIQHEHSRTIQNVRSQFDVFPTQATRQTLGFVFPDGSLNRDTLDTFISYYYGGSNVSSHIIEPHNTLTTVQGSAVIRPVSQDINDWYYRMIKPAEGKKIMAFKDSYIITGDCKEQFIQLGNAVTPPAMDWQIERAIATFN